MGWARGHIWPAWAGDEVLCGMGLGTRFLCGLARIHRNIIILFFFYQIIKPPPPPPPPPHTHTHKHASHSQLTSLTPVLSFESNVTQLLHVCESPPGSVKMPRLVQLVKQLKKELNVPDIMKKIGKKGTYYPDSEDPNMLLPIASCILLGKNLNCCGSQPLAKV